MHLQLFGHVAQDHGLHCLVTVLQESPLALDDCSCDPEQGFVAALQALDEPPCFLQVITHESIVVALVGAADHAGVERIDAQSGRDVGIELDPPDALLFAYENVRHHVLGRPAGELATGARGQRLDQVDGLLQIRLVELQGSLEPVEIARGQRVQLFLDQAPGVLPARRRRIELGQLDEHALAQVARADAGRIAALHQA